jgi:hypothetical protein
VTNTGARGPGKETYIVVLFFVLLYGRYLYDFGLKFLAIANLDLPTFYWTANIVFNEGGSPYPNGVFGPAESLLRQLVYPYLYPPTSIPLLYPLSLLSYEGAKTLLLVANHFGVLICTYLMLFKIMPTGTFTNGKLELMFLLAYVFSFFPIVLTLDHGQTNLFVLAFLCLFWYALKNHYSSVLTAVPLVGAILLKIYPIVLVLLLLVKSRFRVIGWVVVLLALWTGFSYLVLPKSIWRDYFSLVLPQAGYAKDIGGYLLAADPWNQSINGFTSKLFLGTEPFPALVPSAAAAQIAPLALAGLVVLYSTWVSNRVTRLCGDRYIDLEISLFLIVMFLIAPFSWEHHHVLVLPAILVALHSVLFSGNRKALQILIAIAACVIAWKVHHAWPGFQTGILRLAISTKFYAVLILWIVLLWSLRQSIAQCSSEASAD